MNHHVLAVATVATALWLPSFARAALVDLGNGAIYDTTLDITLTKNVRFHETDLSDNNRLYSIIGTSVQNSDGSIHVVTSSDLYQVVPAGVFRVGGTWWGATAWAQTLTFAGASDWRLPTQAELVHVLSDPSFPTAFTNATFGSFSYLMWTSTESTPSTVVQVQTVPFGSPSYYISSIQKSLDQSSSFIQVPWAVHQGNISAVPEPSTTLLLLTGSVLLGTLARSRLRTEASLKKVLLSS